MGRIISLVLIVAGAGGMIFFFTTGSNGWTVMAAGLALTVGVLWLYVDFVGRGSDKWN